MATNDIHMHAKEGGCSMCEGRSMCGGMCGQHHWMFTIIKIAVALLIFWSGVQFGELKSALHANYGGYNTGYGMMGSYGERNRGYYGTPTMMGGWTYTTTAPTTTTIPAPTTAAPTKPK